MTNRFARLALTSLGTALALIALSGQAMADVKSVGRGAPVIKCVTVQVTDCTQSAPNGPVTCTTHPELDCTVVSGVGSALKRE